MRTIINIASYGILLALVSCKAGFEPIDYGKEACAGCKMTIVDARYAAELITAKGRVYKFDDVTCMKKYAGAHSELGAGTKYFVAGYVTPDSKFIDATQAVYIQNAFFKSPMNGNTGAFTTSAEAAHLKDSLVANLISWGDIR